MPLDQSTPPRILVIDDAATYRRYLRQIVETLGATVHEAPDGMTGVERALQDRFALVLVDVNMPGLNGYRVVEALRDEPQTCAVPVIMISSESKPQDRLAAWGVGANLYLTKPVDAERFCQTVRLMLGARVS